MVVLKSGAGGETEALELKTGRSLWTSKLCNFSNHPVDNGAVGVS